MRIGVPREIKQAERRVGLTPTAVRELNLLGHTIWVERGAGAGIGASDENYRKAGADIADTAQEVYANAEMVVKVKEPQSSEILLLNEGQLLFTYLHLAADRELTVALAERGCAAVAYETITASDETLPLLVPMSEIAGRMAVQVGARYLEHTGGGMGKLLGGVPGVLPADVLVIGGGAAGASATRMAAGLGANVTVVDRSLPRLRRLEEIFGARVRLLCSSSSDMLAQHVLESDLVIGAALIPGASAPKLVARELLSSMRRGSVLIDVSIDQGGCFETSRPTSHQDPVYVEDGVIHYCVTNMPGAVPVTSTYALNNATLPYVKRLASGPIRETLAADAHLLNGLNLYRGQVTHEAVAASLGLDYLPPARALH